MREEARTGHTTIRPWRLLAQEETTASEEVVLKYTTVKLETYRGNFSKGKVLNSA